MLVSTVQLYLNVEMQLVKPGSSLNLSHFIKHNFGVAVLMSPLQSITATSNNHLPRLCFICIDSRLCSCHVNYLLLIDILELEALFH